MPILTCPKCGEEFAYAGKRTAASCPDRRCNTHIAVGGLASEREEAGLSIDAVRDRLDERVVLPSDSYGEP